MTFVNPIYNCFVEQRADAFHSLTNQGKLIGAMNRQPDFSIQTKPRDGWVSSIGKVCFPPYWIFLLMQRIALSQIYPAQNLIYGKIIRAKIDPSRVKNSISELIRKGYIVRRLVLENNGIRYSGLLIGHENSIQNGRWLLQATGSRDPIDRGLGFYSRQGLNTVLVDGPGVGESGGWAIPKTMGEAQEAGIRFLETAIKAKQIVLSGFSLGGAALGQAILSHDFKSDVQYTVVFQMTFDRLSNVAKNVFGKWAGKAISWLGLEMDTVFASEKLRKLKIEQIIVQGGTDIPPALAIRKEAFAGDGVIPAKACLGYQLNNLGFVDPKRHFICQDLHKHIPLSNISDTIHQIGRTFSNADRILQNPKERASVIIWISRLWNSLIRATA